MKDRAVDGGDPLDAPVVGVGRDDRIQFRGTRGGAFKELIGEFARGFLGARDLPEAIFNARRLLLSHLPLKEHLKGVFAGFPACIHLDILAVFSSGGELASGRRASRPKLP